MQKLLFERLVLLFQQIITGVSELAQCWVFVITEYTDYWKVSFDKILERIKTSKAYPLGHRTPNRKRIVSGDKVIFYQSGEGGRKFIVSAVVLSAVKDSFQYVFGYVHFSKIRIWQDPVDIYSILDELSLIKNKRRWQSYFQGGIRKIPRKDYERIISYRQLQNSIAEIVGVS